MSVACVASARASIVGVSRIECLVAPPAARPAVTDRARPFIEVLGASLDGGLQLVFPRLLCVFVLCVSVTIALIMSAADVLDVILWRLLLPQAVVAGVEKQILPVQEW